MTTAMLTVAADSGEYTEKAERLAKRLGLSVGNAQDGLMLRFGADGLYLTDGKLKLRGDFKDMIPRLRQSNLSRELLVKAAKIKGVNEGLTAIDATAGLGEDSILLAAAGFSVRLYEYNPIIAALLADALERAKEISELKETVGRMELFCESSLDALPRLETSPDVILLDPMFPARQKSALIKKKFQLLQRLESPCSDEEELVKAAAALRPMKLVIKRPAKGPYLAGIKPSYSIGGKAVRYDCLVFSRDDTHTGEK